MEKEILVKAFQCTIAGVALGFSQEDHETRHDNIVEAAKEASTLVADGIAVIIRPTYNEVDESTGGRFFREWRSFNGAKFQECRWKIS